jgi:hypothetical protein
MGAIKKWINDHPNIWEFILFNVLSNCATITNFVVMWLCTGFIFTAFKDQPFKFFIFNYTTEESLMLCGFLSFLVATAAAQTVNFFVQKNLVFKSNAQFAQAVPKYILLAVVLVIVSAALPAYSQELFVNMGIPQGLAPTLANVVNIVVQVVLSYPAMKFWIMPKTADQGAEQAEQG